VTLKSEILDQPAVLRRLLREHMPEAQRIAAAVARREFDFAFLAARGSSDNAGLYAKYLWGIHNHLPVALAAPSMFSLYQSPPLLKRALVVGISQSGQSPDIVGVIQEGRRQGAPTLAVTDDPGSPLAEAAEFVLYTDTGRERSVAATKTYTAQLLALAMVSVGLRGSAERLEELHRLPDLLTQVLDMDEVVEQAAAAYREMKHCVVLGRGYDYATAHEWALKLKELTYVLAAPYSSADFLHGPVAILEQGFPVLALAPLGGVYPDIVGLLKDLVDRRGVRLLVVSNSDEALALAETPLRLPAELPPWISPIVTVVPAQLFSYHLARAKGLDVEHPRSLQKVTRTW
jgi:glucosamine--fructose-6-phosphate aminotransferase (isomerizing)